MERGNPMDSERNAKIAKILDHYGSKHQMQKCCEELAELQCEILKYLNKKGSLNKIFDEMIDVIVTVEQLKKMLPVSEEQINKHIDFKLDRTIERMEKE